MKGRKCSNDARRSVAINASASEIEQKLKAKRMISPRKVRSCTASRSVAGSERSPPGRCVRRRSVSLDAYWLGSFVSSEPAT